MIYALLTSIILQAGRHPDDPLQYWIDALNGEGSFIDAVVYTFGDTTGVGVFFLIIFGVTFLIVYQATDSVMVPVAVLVVLAPLLAGLFPAIGMQFIAVVLVLAVAVLGMYAFMNARIT